jgi:hypothetical protein
MNIEKNKIPLTYMFYNKKDMLEHTLTLEKSPELYIMYLDSNEKHRFTYFNKYDNFVKNLKLFDVNGKYYIDEMILNGQKRKPYLDLEKIYSDENIMNKKLIKIIKKLQLDLITVFKNQYNKKITENDILILNSSGEINGKYKLSLHIIISPENKTFYYTDSKFTNSSSFHLYTSLINLDKNYTKLLDPSVYKIDFNFRIYGSYKKFNDNRCLLPYVNNIKITNPEKSDDDQSSENDSDNDNDSGSDSGNDSDNYSDNESDNNSDNESDNDSDNDSDNESCNDSDNEIGNDSDNDDDSNDESNSESDNNSKKLDNGTKILIPINRNMVDYFLTNIKPRNIKLNTPILQQTEKRRNTISYNKPTKTNLSECLLKMVHKVHPTATLNGFYKDMYYNFNYTDRTEICPISGKTHKGSNGFYVFANDRGYYLKCFSKKCTNKSKHIGYVDTADEYIDTALQIDQQYLIMNGDINDNDEFVCKMIRKWLEDNEIKTFVVKSPMGTGKTTMIEKILQYDDSIKKVLWITHRQSLTKQIYGKFKVFDFKNYMDNDGSLRDLDRVIVQVDSIERILSIDDSDNTCKFNIYDLIFIDEIEGNLYHYCSPFLNKPNRNARSLFNFMILCVQHAKKLLVIDADIGMRSKIFVDYLDKSIFINNNYKPIQKTFIVTNNRTKYLNALFNDIKEGKNICIISMSSSILNKFEKKIKKENVEYIMHTSSTDDKLKNELEDVNSFWSKFQVVLYSPTIESGVDFNMKHFDKIYCVIKSGNMTCSQRSFLQMVGRIRHVECTDILCFYNGSKKLNASIYTYDDILSYFRYYESLNSKKVIQDIEYDITVTENEVIMNRKFADISLFDNISIYNEVEQLNKHPDIFLSVLNKLIQRSGHELVLNINPALNKKLFKPVQYDKIFMEINESEYDFKDLIIKQNKNKLNEQEKLVLKKIFFNKTFGIKCTSNKTEFQDFYNNFHNKVIIFKKFVKFFGYDNKSDDDDEQFDNLNDGKDKARHKIIVDLINRFIHVGSSEMGKKKYTTNDLINIEINNKQYIDAARDIIKNSIYFSDEDKNRALFFKSKSQSKNKDKTIDANNCKWFSRFIVSLFHGVGIIFTSQQKRIKGTKKRQYNHKINVNPLLKKIADFKYKITKDIDIYKDLFITNNKIQKCIVNLSDIDVIA